MYACPTCATPVAGSEPACPACGSDLDIALSPTGTAPHPTSLRTPSGDKPPRTPSGEKPRTPSNGGGRRTGERFVPGTVVAERYRITGLLGRGGMGEVYRADDLKLDQPVALKFLPHGLDSDGERLARFYREVRIARQVSHAAVCRVYDVAEAEGHFFLSMELVDGENLASLLRRIGRLPAGQGARDRAAALRRAGRGAREGRAAPRPEARERDARRPGQRAHHRLRPGRPRRVAAPRRRALGDARYMSPEQLAGREVTVRSDIYALGLVLYELFTGRRAFEGKSLAELHAQAPRRAADRALSARRRPRPRGRARDPALPREGAAPPPGLAARSSRPCSPGGDPLEAALAAGETPSPEVVAAAGEAHGLRPAVAWACSAVTLVGLAFVPLAGSTYRLLERVPAGKAPAALEDRARDFVRRMAPDAGCRRRHLGPRGGVGLHRTRGREGLVARPLGRPPGRQPSARPAVVPPEPAPARLDAPERQGALDEAAPGRERHGRGRLRHGGAAAHVLRRPAPARAGAGQRRRLLPTGPRSSPKRASIRPASVRWRHAGRRGSSSTRAPPGRDPGRAGQT